jgi:GNAT superfamily N-acetyltransferase
MEDSAVRLYGAADITLRRAESKDLPSIVDLLADDPLGSTREGTDAGYGTYEHALEGVRVARNYRSRGLGAAMIQWAIRTNGWASSPPTGGSR